MIKKDVFLIQETTASNWIEPLCEEQILDLGIPVLTENIKAGRKGGTVFKTVLQEAGAINKNKRTYNKKALEEALLNEKNLIENGIFFGEMDHPSTSDPARFGKVEIKNACYRVLGYDWNGSILNGVCETLCNTPGKDMRALIVENGIKLGFSLRAMGKTTTNPSTGITEVLSPMKVFCYDLVSNPSHANARLSEVLSESQIIPNDSAMNMIMENCDNVLAIAESYGIGNAEQFITSGNFVVTPDNGMAMMRIDNTTIQAFLEENVVNSFLKAKKSFSL